jgi:ABC-type sugar transport system substrate-binding protein
MTIRRKFALAIAGIAVLGLSACGTVGGGSSAQTDSTKEVKDVTIGFLQRQLDAPYYSAMQTMAQDLAKKEGFKLRFQNASGDPVTQLDQAQTMLSQGVDALIINAVSPDTEKVKLLQDAKQVPIIFIDTGIEGVGVTSVSSDNKAIGKLSGELTAKRFKQGETVPMAILNGGPTDVVVGPDRQSGFLAGLKAGGVNYDIVAETSAVYATDKAVPATESMLAAHPDLKLILGLNDAMALGALQVLHDQGNTTTLVAASADGQKQALKAIKDGGCTGQYVSTGLNSPSLATNRAFQVALDIATGKQKASSFDKSEFTKPAGIGCENVDKYYDANSEF